MKMHNKGFTSFELAIAFVIGAILVLAGVLFYSRVQDNNKKNAEKPTTIYASQEYHFSFNYPEEWGTFKQADASKKELPLAYKTPPVNTGLSVGTANFSSYATMVVSSKEAEQSNPGGSKDHTSEHGVKVKSYKVQGEGSIIQTIAFDSHNVRVTFTLPVLSKQSGEFSNDEIQQYEMLTSNIIKSVRLSE